MSCIIYDIESEALIRGLGRSSSALPAENYSTTVKCKLAKVQRTRDARGGLTEEREW